MSTKTNTNINQLNPLKIMATWNSFEQSNTIVVNGISMSMIEYRKQMKAKTAKPKRRVKKQLTEIQLLPNELTYLMKQVRVIKSLGAYYTNGYRQWGTKCRDYVLNLEETNIHFVRFQLRSEELMKIMQDIKKLAKLKEKAIYQYVEKFVYKLDDIKEQMELLYKGVRASNVMEQFKDYEFINGTQRRLGLKILMVRTAKAIDELDVIIHKLTDITTKGVDAFNYRTEISKWGDTI